MKIINLKAENFKRLSAIDITPTGDVIQITGKNKQGKSSILETIDALFEGSGAMPEKPVKIGESKGKLHMAIGEGPDRIEYLVSKTFSTKNPKGTLTIESVDGGKNSSPQKISSPQTLLDQIIGKLSFDPLAFINKDNKEQRDIVLGLMGVDIDGIDKEIKRLKDERQIKGRDVKKAEGHYNSLPAIVPGAPDKEVSAAELTDKLTKAIAHNQEMTDAQAALDTLKAAGTARLESIKTKEAEIEQKRAEIAALEEGNKLIQAEVDNIRAEWRKKRDALDLKEAIEIQPIQDEISKIDETNKTVRNNADNNKAGTDLQTLQKEYDNFTLQIQAKEKEKTTALESCEIPVPGLTLGEEKLLYNNLPISQCSAAEAITIGLTIGMKMNPKLRVLRIKDASLLDEDSLAVIRKLTADHDFQIWLECVDSSGKVGFYIEDGTVKAVN